MKRKVAAVDVGSLEVGPRSACPNESWILSVEVAEIDEAWTTHTEVWVMVDSGPGVSTRQSLRSSQVRSNLPIVRAGGHRIEHIGQKSVGYATRESANVEIAFEAAKVRRPLLSVDSLVERGQVWQCSRREAEHEATERTLLAAGARRIET